MNRRTKLTEDELEYLATRNHSADDVLIAPNLMVKDKKKAAKQLGKLYFLGSSCGTCGFEIRLRAGHCWRCNPAGDVFRKRYTEKGYVYIAYSPNTELVKVGGTTKSVDEREDELRTGKYANANDWIITIWIAVINYGEIENDILEQLEEHQEIILYSKYGENQAAIEAFTCSVAVAEGAMKTTLKMYGVGLDGIQSLN